MVRNCDFTSSSYLLLKFIVLLISILIIFPKTAQSAGPDDNNLLIFYRLTGESNCGNHPPITLGDFLKRTLAGEVGDFTSLEALKANAVASRSFTLSPQTVDIYTHTDGQKYHCTDAAKQGGFELNKPLVPIVNDAVEQTNGMIMTHPDVTNRETFENWPLVMRFGAIQASYTKENGPLTQEDPQHAWLKEVYDPISLGRSAVNPSFFYGMGQDASERWANGVDPLTGNDFPKWDYRRILAHYYTGIEFVGPIFPDPPESLRATMLQIEGIGSLPGPIQPL